MLMFVVEAYSYPKELEKDLYYEGRKHYSAYNGANNKQGTHVWQVVHVLVSHDLEVRRKRLSLIKLIYCMIDLLNRQEVKDRDS